MKTSSPRPRSHLVAFTLIELIVVIGIIALLAALIFPVAGVVRRGRMLKLAGAELSQMQTAIEAYKAKIGSYPPDNPGNAVTNQLYYELEGTVRSPVRGIYTTIDGSSQVTPAILAGAFGPNVSGFMNSSSNARNTDEGTAAVNFLKAGLRPNQVCQLTSGITILVCSVPWLNEDDTTWPIRRGGFPMPPPIVNPWRYVSTNPTNNPGSYDLWVDLYIGGKVYRVNNWTKQPELVH
jgi:prepilin-type N-terminal cleavage/methylation domain-containing protein